jgi:hypothetical protein
MYLGEHRSTAQAAEEAVPARNNIFLLAEMRVSCEICEGLKLIYRGANI